jgi:tetratricopeptide (TPR) repeat protein
MIIPFRTRLSVHLVAALSPTPVKVVHAAFVVVTFVMPLLATELLPGLLILCWPPLVTWVMFYLAAKEETETLPELHARAVAREDADAIAAVTSLVRVLATSGRPDPNRTAFLAYATARAGDPEEGAAIARSALDRFSRTDDRRAALEGALGVALAIGERPREAIGPLAAALRIDPNAAETGERAYFLAMAYRATGRDEEVRANLRIAAESDAPCAAQARALLDRATVFRG